MLGAATLFPVLALLRRPMKIVAVRQMVLLGILQTAAFTALIQWALVAGGAGKTAVPVYAMPFWVVALAWWGLGERVRSVWCEHYAACLNLGIRLVMDTSFCRWN